MNVRFVVLMFEGAEERGERLMKLSSWLDELVIPGLRGNIC